MAATETTPRPVVIRALPRWVPPRADELWPNRELIYFLAWRELKVRYAQTLLGGLWTVVQPIAMVLVFTLAFRKLGNVTTGGIPYPLFALSGMVLWMFFSRGVTYGANSLVANVNLVTKSACPRLIIPLASSVVGIVDFLVTFVLMLALATGYGMYPDWRIAFVPLIVLFTLVLVLALALPLAALNVRYRDIKQSLPFVVQFLLFLSPVAYPLRSLGEPWATVFSINPLVALIDAFRWSTVGGPAPTAASVAISIGVTVLVLAGGLLYFANAERRFADVA